MKVYRRSSSYFYLMIDSKPSFYDNEGRHAPHDIAVWLHRAARSYDEEIELTSLQVMGILTSINDRLFHAQRFYPGEQSALVGRLNRVSKVLREWYGL